MFEIKKAYQLFACVLAMVPIGLHAQEDVFAEYREMMGDDNPAIFVIEEGEEYWYAEAGPKAQTLEACDLGLGPGVVDGAYAQLPRYFEDTGRVMDLEGRLEYCMIELQGRTREEIHTKPYSLQGDLGTEMEALSAWIVDRSNGVPMQPGSQHPQEVALTELGQQIFYFRAGPHDFSCATCHEQSDMRIRLQALPDLTTAKGGADGYTTWPAYRISEGLVRTMGWRMRDCFRQQRLPELVMGSEATVALQLYLANKATGAPMAAPGLKR